MIEFKIIDAPDQQFGAILQGRRTTIRLRYSPLINRWSFNLAIDDQLVLRPRKIVTGVDLLDPFNFGIGMLKAMRIDPLSDVEEGYDELVQGLVRLYHISDDDVAARQATL